MRNPREEWRVGENCSSSGGGRHRERKIRKSRGKRRKKRSERRGRNPRMGKRYGRGIS
jgi:hypothetical protein